MITTTLKATLVEYAITATLAMFVTGVSYGSTGTCVHGNKNTSCKGYTWTCSNGTSCDGLSSTHPCTGKCS